MFKKLKLKLATAKVKSEKEKADNKKTSFPERVKSALVAFGAKTKKTATDFYKWVRGLDMVGLVNSTLLISIIVLFSVLIMNIFNSNKNSDMKIVQNTQSEKRIEFPQPVDIFEEAYTDAVKKPIVVQRPNKVLAANEENDTIKSVQNVVNGGFVIDGDFPGTKLSNGTIVKGNLYLQNMYKYTLPCKVYIDGDLFLRNVGMLRFAGSFVVTGNIYVSHNSSFGPLPKNARLDGQVIF